MDILSETKIRGWTPETIDYTLIDFLKLIDNSTSWNKENHKREGGLDTRF